MVLVDLYAVNQVLRCAWHKKQYMPGCKKIQPKVTSNAYGKAFCLSDRSRLPRNVCQCEI